MTTVSLRIDDKMKKELDDMCAEMGMNITRIQESQQQLEDGRVIEKTMEELEAMEHE